MLRHMWYYLNDPICDNYSVLLVLGADKPVRGASRKHDMAHIRSAAYTDQAIDQADRAVDELVAANATQP